MTRILSSGSALAFGVALLCSVSPALADTKSECAQAYEAAQEQRGGGKLRAAKESLVTCSQAACASFIKKDCAKWLSEVEAAIPTVVFSARAGKQDLTDVKVTLGDQALASALDGKAIPMDPGTHTFVFEHEKYGSKEVKFVIKEGKKAQAIEVVFEGEDSGGGAAGGDSGGDTRGDKGGVKVGTDGVKGSNTLGFVLVGLGVVGLGGFTYFALSGKSDENGLKCAEFKTCTDDDLDPIKQKYLFADISLGVGVVALGVGTVLLLTSGPKKEGPTAKARPFRLDVVPTKGGGYGMVTGLF